MQEVRGASASKNVDTIPETPPAVIVTAPEHVPALRAAGYASARQRALRSPEALGTVAVRGLRHDRRGRVGV